MYIKANTLFSLVIKFLKDFSRLTVSVLVFKTAHQETLVTQCGEGGAGHGSGCKNPGVCLWLPLLHPIGT